MIFLFNFYKNNVYQSCSLSMSKPSLSMIYVNFQTSNEFLEIFSENVFGSVILLISRPANNPKPVMEKN